MPGLDDFTDRLSNHDLADVDALRVAFRIAHAPAHVRVERDPEVPDQHLAVAAPGQRRALDAEIVFAHRVLRAARQHDAPVFHLQRSEAREVMIGVAELLRRHGQPPEAVAQLSSSLMPMPPCSCTASWLTWRALSAILIFAADTERERSAALAA